MSEEKSRSDELISASQAGKMLGVSGKTVVRLMQDGEIPGYRIGFTWKFKRGDIERYLESRRYRPGQENNDN